MESTHTAKCTSTVNKQYQFFFVSYIAICILDIFLHKIPFSFKIKHIATIEAYHIPEDLSFEENPNQNASKENMKYLVCFKNTFIVMVFNKKTLKSNRFWKDFTKM